MITKTAPDSHSEKTKNRFKEALKSLMLEKPFSKITVNDLAAAAKLNRNSFYYHFKNTYDLLKWTIEQEALDHLRHINTLDNIEDAVSFILDYIDTNREFCACTHESFGSSELKRAFARDFDQIVANLINTVATSENYQISDDFKHFLVYSYTELIASYLTYYLNKNVTLTRTQIINFLSTTTRTALKSALAAAHQSHL